MPIDLELEKGPDGYYSIVSAFPKGKIKVEGLLLFDGDTPPSSVTATDSLIRLADNKSGVNYHGVKAMSNNPSAESVSQVQEEDKKAEGSYKEIIRGYSLGYYFEDAKKKNPKKPVIVIKGDFTTDFGKRIFAHFVEYGKPKITSPQLASFQFNKYQSLYMFKEFYDSNGWISPELHLEEEKLRLDAFNLIPREFPRLYRRRDESRFSY